MGNIFWEYIRITPNIHWEETACMRIEDELITCTKIKKGGWVKQGCLFSTDLFNVDNVVAVGNDDDDNDERAGDDVDSNGDNIVDHDDCGGNNFDGYNNDSGIDVFEDDNDVVVMLKMLEMEGGNVEGGNVEGGNVEGGNVEGGNVRV